MNRKLSDGTGDPPAICENRLLQTEPAASAFCWFGNFSSPPLSLSASKPHQFNAVDCCGDFQSGHRFAPHPQGILCSAFQSRHQHPKPNTSRTSTALGAMFVLLVAWLATAQRALAAKDAGQNCVRLAKPKISGEGVAVATREPAHRPR